MTTWDEIKKETEKGATRLWADDDEDELLPVTSATPREIEHTKSPSVSEWADDEPLPANSHSKEQDSALGKTNANANAGQQACIHDFSFNKSFVDAVLGTGYRSQCVLPLSFDSNTTEFPSGIKEGLYQPRDPIGIRSIQSIMMSATQMNLSHFHTAGMSSLSSSSSSPSSLFKPSAADAMNSIYTKNNTSMKFTMHRILDSVYNDKFERLRYLRKHLVGASLGHFVRKIGSNITELPDRENIWYNTKIHSKSKLNSGFESTEVPGILLRIYIDYNKMHNHGLTLENLAQEIFGSDCSWNVSPDFMGMIDISIQVTYISQWLSRIKHRVCGTSDVLSCNFIDSGEHQSFLFYTRGTNVLAACKVPGIDKSTIELNNVISVEKHFGIEAAASVLADLTRNVIVSDFMARTGKVLHFSKYSNEVKSKGLLTSMGFERPKDDIRREINTEKTLISKSRRIGSVYEHIITGMDPPRGFSLHDNTMKKLY